MEWTDVVAAVERGEITRRKAWAIWRAEFRAVSALEVARILCDITLAEAARRCGVSPRVYRRWEDNGRWPRGMMARVDPECDPDEDPGE